MKKLFALGAAALMALGLASCEVPTQAPTAPQTPTAGEKTPTAEPTKPAVGKTINLLYSGTASDEEFNQGLFDKFREYRKSIGDLNTYVIEYAQHGPDAVDSEVLDWTVGPDVYEFASDKLSVLYSKGALSPVEGIYADFIDDELNGFAQVCATFNDRYYAFPYTGDNTYYLQYDKSIITDDLFVYDEKLKTNTIDIMKLLDAAHAEGKKVGYALGTAYWSVGAMFTFGADFKVKYTEAGNVESVTADFNTEKGLKAATAILNIINHPAFEDSAAVPTLSNDIVATIGGTWDIAKIQKFYDEDYACAVMPTVTIDGETKNLGAFLGGKLLGVNPLMADGDQDRLQAAYDLAMFLAGYECQLARFEHASIAPCHLEASADERVLASPNVAVLSAQGKFAHAQTSVPQSVWDCMTVMITDMKTGEGKVTVENLQSYVNGVNKTATGEKTTE